MNNPRPIRPQVALEMTMQDVLGNMAELAMDFGFHDMGGEFEIISIEPAQTSERNDITPPPSHVREILSAEVSPLYASNASPHKVAI